jgi:hypothetical protein
MERLSGSPCIGRFEEVLYREVARSTGRFEVAQYSEVLEGALYMKVAPV